MKQLIKRIIKKGISWYVDPLYRENQGLKEDIQRLYQKDEKLQKRNQDICALLNAFITEDTAIAQNVHGGGTFAHNIVPPDGIRMWIYRVGDAGRLAIRYLKECTGAKLIGLIDDSAIGTTYQGNTILSLAEAIKRIDENDWILFCGDGQANSFSYRKLQCVLWARGVTAPILHFWDLDIRSMFSRLTLEGYDKRFVSRLCAYEDFEDPIFLKLCDRFHPSLLNLCSGLDGKSVIHRKKWEWAYIVRVLESFDCLKPGAKGLGFAVGTEPLPSYFASLNVKVLATDLNPEAEEAQSWLATNQGCGGSINLLFKKELCTRTKFEENVSFRYIDMNVIPENLQDYDFCWSSCAIEHVGSLEQSKQFLKNMLRCLRPGGVAVHTTEFNLSSDVDTIETGNSVLFRKKDIEEIKEYFLNLGCEMETSYFRSNAEENGQVDIFPFYSHGAPPHINLVIGGYASTSFAIVVRKPS